MASDSFQSRQLCNGKKTKKNTKLVIPWSQEAIVMCYNDQYILFWAQLFAQLSQETAVNIILSSYDTMIMTHLWIYIVGKTSQFYVKVICKWDEFVLYVFYY